MLRSRPVPTRREAALGGLLSIIWGAGCHTCGAQVRRARTGFGCVLDPDEAEPFLATASGVQLFVTGKEQVIASTGNREFDYALAQTLSRLTDTFNVLPGFTYYDDYDGENAYATSVRRLQRADGTVLFGKRYFLSQISQPEHPEVAVAATCAHEFAHILQYKRGLTRLDAGQRTVKRSELHADFLSGFFAGKRKLEKPDYPAAVFAADAHASGDDDVRSKDHHGTPDERAAAVVRGFETAYRERRNLGEAIQVGINYVSRL
jgi:hypothetical protein